VIYYNDNDPFCCAWLKELKESGTVKPSLTVARRLFPNLDLHRKADHNRADALLIAEWARRQG